MTPGISDVPRMLGIATKITNTLLRAESIDVHSMSISDTIPFQSTTPYKLVMFITSSIGY